MHRVLLIEDSGTYRALLKGVLNEQFPNMVIAEAGSGEEALKMLGLFKPELIFLDINLPGDSGLVVAEKVRASGSNAKIVLLTSYDLAEYRAAAAEHGASFFMAKDASTRGDILSVVRTALST
jgi:DNA-binding NarL/FixJ family response regulator